MQVSRTLLRTDKSDNRSLESLYSNPFFVLLLVVPFTPPASYLMSNFAETIFDSWLCLSCIVILFLSICGNFKIDGSFGFYIAFNLVLVISTILTPEGARLKTSLIYFASNIGFILLLINGIRESGDKFMKIVFVYGVALMILNAGTMFYYYDLGGMNPLSGQIEYGILKYDGSYYLLGRDNHSFFRIFFFTVLGWTIVARNASKLYFGLALSTTIMQMIAYWYVGSATAAVCYTISLLFPLFLIRKPPESFIFNFRNVLLLCILINILIIGFNVQVQFSDVLESLFGKDVGLNNRVAIWERALHWINERPLIGYGYQDNLTVYGMLGINHVHNMYLDLIFRGGIVALFFFMLFLISVGKVAHENKSDKAVRIVVFGLFIYWISVIFDFYYYDSTIFGIYFLITSISSISSFRDEACAAVISR